MGLCADFAQNRRSGDESCTIFEQKAKINALSKKKTGKQRATRKLFCYTFVLFRGVAQPGSALAWGARGREFESRRPDQKDQTEPVMQITGSVSFCGAVFSGRRFLFRFGSLLSLVSRMWRHAIASVSCLQSAIGRRSGRFRRPVQPCALRACAEASGPAGGVLETDVERHGGQRERQTEQIGQARVGIAKGRQQNVQGINHGAGAIAHQRIDP